MCKNEGIQAKIDMVKVEIANHYRDWFGMVGTCWEREDMQRKQKQLREYREILAKEESQRRRVCNVQ